MDAKEKRYNNDRILPKEHFLSQRYITDLDTLDTSTLAATDFDVDPRSAFLPPDEPLKRLDGEYLIWELALDAALQLPLQLDGSNGEVSEQWRDAIRSMISVKPPTINSNGIRVVRRAYTVLSYIAHFYVHSSRSLENKITIPSPIAVPWNHTASALGLPPILTYASTVLWNWEYIDPSKGLVEGNLRAPLTFTRSRDEEHFFLTSAYIEAAGRLCLERMSQCLDEAFMADMSPDVSYRSMSKQLTEISNHINILTRILIDVRKECRPEVFYGKIRRWFNGPNGQSSWHYEGVDPPGVYRDYGGPSAGQSSLIHSLDAFLGVNHAPVDDDADYDDTFMRRMQFYMPEYHRNFLDHLLNVEPSCRDVVKASDNDELKESYNKAIESMKVFRSEHIKIATLYIVTQSRKNTSIVDDSTSEPKGTGGTSLVKFLKTCRDRTYSTLL